MQKSAGSILIPFPTLAKTLVPGNGRLPVPAITTTFSSALTGESSLSPGIGGKHRAMVTGIETGQDQIITGTES